MSSIYGADNPYYANFPNIAVQYSYHKDSVMGYVYDNCPLFAFFLQMIGKDRDFDAPDLNCTCFVPSITYSNAYLDYFKDTNFYFSEKVIFNSTIAGLIEINDLRMEEKIPNKMDNYITVSCAENDDVFVNGLKILFSVKCSNGIVHVMDGMINFNDDFLN